MQNTGNKQFYLICGARLAQRWPNVTKIWKSCTPLCNVGPTLGQRQQFVYC